MTTPPGQGQPKTKTVDGKEGEFIWCAFHQAWGKHHEGTCEAKKKQLSGSKSSKGKSDDKALKINKALATIIKREDDDSD